MKFLLVIVSIEERLKYHMMMLLML